VACKPLPKKRTKELHGKLQSQFQLNYS